MQALRRLCAALCLSTLLLQSAWTWNDTGHMVIATIAYQRLTPKARSAIQYLLGDLTAFVESAVWADEHKSPSTSDWHYVDHYFRSDGATVNLEPKDENVEWALLRFDQVLKDKKQSREARAKALKYLIHFVADIHQPLHCASRVSDVQPNGDRGGNAFKILTPTGLEARPRNLHALWDDGCGLFDERHAPPLGYDDLVHIARIANVAEKGNASEARQAAKVLNVAAWSGEGLRLCQTAVYDLQEGERPSPDYLAHGQAICAERATIAGYRLAAVLNKLLG